MSQERKKTMLDYAYFEGEVRPSAEAQISIASHTIQYGTCVFGGIRGYFEDGVGRMFRVRDHWQRLMNAAKIFGMDYYMEFDEFMDVVQKLIDANKPANGFYIRPFIYSDDEILTPCFDKINYKLALYMISLGDYLDTSRGLRLMISSYQKFPEAAISTKAKAGGSYLNSSSARTEASRLGYDEALVMDSNWKIVEGSAENLLVIYRGEAIMPPIGADALEGITLRTVKELLQDAGIPIRYESIDRSMIYTADEVMLTGTGAQIVFAESVDDRKIANGEMGEVCKMLRENFENLVAMKHPRSKDLVYEFKIN